MNIILDVETAGTFGKSLVYDLGFIVVDNNGTIIDSRNWVIDDIYYGMKDKMQTAYYAEKLPTYDIEIANGEREVISMANAYKEFADICEYYKVRKAYAFNAIFDYKALNYTSKVCSNGFITEFLPANVKMNCILGASLSTICNSKKYADFAERTEKGNIRVNAENVYRYITQDIEFIEAHTGLADAIIENEILKACKKRHQAMDTEPKPLQSFTNYQLIQKKYR